MKISQEQRHEKSFEDLIKILQTMYNQAVKNKRVVSKLRVANNFLTDLITELEKNHSKKDD
tara:strand:+ start:276 stop:458 length:183 start_codon:yes stop_codon:yes gene_type:complete